jgi:hypothetical protein
MAATGPERPPTDPRSSPQVSQDPVSRTGHVRRRRLTKMSHVERVRADLVRWLDYYESHGMTAWAADQREAIRRLDAGEFQYVV